MKLYGHPISGNSHRVQAMLELLRLDYEFTQVNLSSSDHKKPEFLALNPLGQVPVLVDGEVVLRDSTAILIYLAEKYDTSGTWLPKEAEARAQVQQWLSTAVHEVMNGPFMIRAMKLFGSLGDADALKARTETLYDTLFEPHLLKNEWLVGNAPSIADVACYSYVYRVTDGDFSLENYPAIKAWAARIEALDKMPPMRSGADIMAAL